MLSNIFEAQFGLLCIVARIVLQKFLKKILKEPNVQRLIMIFRLLMFFRKAFFKPEF